jgi:hypothetical protein
MSLFRCYATVGRIEEGCGYTVLWLPEAVREKFSDTQSGRRRIEAVLADQIWNAAIQLHRGRPYLLLSKRRLKEWDLKLGDEIELSLGDTDQNRVDLPEELIQALLSDSEFAGAWGKLTAGKQRGYAHAVASAKRSDTREARAAKVIQEVLHPGSQSLFRRGPSS